MFRRDILLSDGRDGFRISRYTMSIAFWEHMAYLTVLPGTA